MNNHKIEHEHKLNTLKTKLYEDGIRCYSGLVEHKERYYQVTNRQAIREFIAGKLEIHDTHTINSWIDELVGLGIFEHNPDSQRTVNGHTKPSNDTRYFIHFEKCSHTHIDSYRSSAESQKETKREPPEQKPLSL